MEVQIREKVHVVFGSEMQEEDGFSTLKWVIKKWGSHNFLLSIVIFIINSSSSMEFVNTPFGKQPVSAVSDELLQIMRKGEQEKLDSLHSKYAAFCGKFFKFKTEIDRIEKHEGPKQMTVLKLIMEHRVTKLVMGMSLSKSSSGSLKSAVIGSFYLHRNKPEFCEIHFLSNGKLVILKGENAEEGHLEDEEGVIIAKLKNRGSFRDWFEKKIASSINGKSPVCPSSTPPSVDSDLVSKNSWENNEGQIDEYLQKLLRKLRSNSKSNSGFSLNSPVEQDIHSIKDVVDVMGALKKEVQVVHKKMELYKNKACEEADKQSKASWAISLCSRRVEDLEALVSKENTLRGELTKELDNMKAQQSKILSDGQEMKARLRSLLELQAELSVKLQAASLAKLGAETKLEDAASSRTELVREIEELRKQRDVFQRRIEFCKEKDAIGLATRMASTGDEVSCSYVEFSADEIRLATDDFASHRRLKSGGDWTNVYKGKINCSSVAIKMLNWVDDLSQEIFQAKVNLLGNIRHPHITALIGFCSELKCMVFEYMHNGCLRDILFSRRKSSVLHWHQRIHISAQVSSTLGSLHLTNPNPIVHGRLNPSTVFLDRHFKAKIHALELTRCQDQADLRADVGAFGNLLLQILTGRNWAGLDQESITMNGKAILDALDDSAGEWPMNLAEEVAMIALKCRSVCLEEANGGLMSPIAEQLNHLRKTADYLVERKDLHMETGNFFHCRYDSSHVPAIFLCPIYQIVMENPHTAADGYSYELEAIEEWLKMEHDTSPVTNMKLEHKYLIPNKTLRFMIQDWRSNKSYSPS